MKDEGLLPTGAFKARGAAVGVSRAAELGVTGIAMPTNGNAGAAWAVYAARAGLGALVAMPVDAPVITRRECVVAGAELYLVDGLIGDAGAHGRGGRRRAGPAGRTPRRCASRTGSRARRRWASRSPSSSAGGAPT